MDGWNHNHFVATNSVRELAPFQAQTGENLIQFTMQMPHSDLEQPLYSPDFPKTKSSLQQVSDWLIYLEDKVICSLVDREFGFLIYKE